MRISLIIPAWNEEEALPKVVEEIPDSVNEIIIVDDGSTDDTHIIAKEYEKKYPNVKVYKHKANSGKVAAIRTGIKNATGDIIVLTDADFTYPASDIIHLVNEVDAGADLVLGSRFMNGINNMPLLNRIGNKIFSLFTSYISGTFITDGQTGFRAFKRERFNKLDVKAKSLEFETKMTVRAAKHGYIVAEVPIHYRERIGKSKLNPIPDGYRMFRALISVANSETSMLAKVIMMPSIIFMLFGMLFGIISAWEYLSQGMPLHPYYPLLTVFLILIGIQLFSLGLIIDNLTKKLERIDERVMRVKKLISDK